MIKVEVCLDLWKINLGHEAEETRVTHSRERWMQKRS